MLLLPLLLLLFSPVLPFLFPSSNSGNCGCTCTPPPSTCPTYASCPQITTCQSAPTPVCCNSCNSCKNKKLRRRRQAVLSNATYVADYDETPRVKREVDSTKCNSEELRAIIEKNIDRVTAIAKRRIQEEAESKLKSRFNVICARGDFSYVANTELFCQHSVGDVTCFLFKQLSDVVRRRLM